MDRMAADFLLLLVFQYCTTGCGDLGRKKQRLKYHYYLKASRTTDRNGTKREIFLVMIMIVITNDKMTETARRWSRSI
jgi:hypothetical protein